MGRHASNFEDKVVWLVAHPSIVACWPTNYSDADIVKMMKMDGLVSPNSKSHVIQDMGKLIAEARSRLRSIRRRTAI